MMPCPIISNFKDQLNVSRENQTTHQPRICKFFSYHSIAKSTTIDECMKILIDCHSTYAEAYPSPTRHYQHQQIMEMLARLGYRCNPTRGTTSAIFSLQLIQKFFD